MVLDVHRLRLLRELKHRGTLAAVARALSYSPSAVSQQLSLLESEVGVPLLEPVGRRVRLTAQAEILVSHTEAVLRRLERAEADLAASLGAVGGTLRVACFQTVALTLLPPVLARLGELHPALRIEVDEQEPEDSLPALVARRFDLVIGEEYPGHPARRAPELEHHDLVRDPMRLALPGTGAAAPALADLADRPWAMEPEGSASRHWATAVCRAAGFEPDVRYTSSDLLVHVRLVESGLAAALLPDLLWRAAAPVASLHPLPGDPARRVFTAVRRGAGRHPAILALRDGLSTAVAAAADPGPTG